MQLGAKVIHLTQLGGCFRDKFLQMCAEVRGLLCVPCRT